MNRAFSASPNESGIPSLAWKKSGTRDTSTMQSLLRDSPLVSAKQILEFLPGDGICSRLVLEKLGPIQNYLGLEIGANNRDLSALALADIPGTRVESIPKSCEFPVEANSQDLVLASFALNYVRMDQLYMFFSESRRVLHPGGELVLSGASLPKTFLEKIRAKFWCRANQAQCLSLNHYLSPEDWDTKFYSETKFDGLRTEALIFTRRNS